MPVIIKKVKNGVSIDHETIPTKSPFESMLAEAKQAMLAGDQKKFQQIAEQYRQKSLGRICAAVKKAGGLK